MHPPHFTKNQRLSDWQDCIVEIKCCTGTHSMPVKLLLHRHGDMTFVRLLDKLRCPKCRNQPSPVYLNASHHREHCGGPPPDWSLELLPGPESRLPLRPKEPVTKGETVVLQLRK